MKRPTPAQAVGLVLISPLLLVLAVLALGAVLVEAGFEYVGELLP